MKKLNIKQIRWAENKIQAARASKMKRLFLTVFGIIAFAMIGIAATSDVTIDEASGPIGTTVLTGTVMGAVGSIEQVTGDKRTGKKVGYKIFLVSLDQVDVEKFPARNDYEISTIPLKAGEFWHYIGTVFDTPELKITGAEGEIASTITKDLSFTVGGLSKKLIALMETGIGGGFYLVVQECGTDTEWIVGTKCKPAKLKSFDGGLLKDYTAVNMVFGNEDGTTISQYTGTHATASAEVIAADAVTIGLTAKEEYQLTDGTAASVEITGFTNVSDDDVDRYVTILGSGGDHPSTIPAGNDFMLADGVTWTANAGGKITFRIFKDGAASYKFVEVAGSRV